MSPDEPRNPLNDPETANTVPRRRFLVLGAGVGATVLAGCSSTSGPDDGAGGGPTAGGTTEPASDAGTFRLLISDQPVAIGDFDELNVSFDRARIFRGEGADDDEGEGETATETETETETETATETETETATGADTETELETEDDADDGQRGFFFIDLEGATVDLTQVVGEKAIGVFDGELPAGRYTKVELYAAGVEGLVDGEPVEVKIPSGKLQIVKPFEVVAGETLTFVFDINVVKKGQGDEYNLLPVISESGVAGEDVEVEEVGAGTDDSGEDGDAEDDEPGENAGEAGGDNGEGDGPPDEAGGDE